MIGSSFSDLTNKVSRYWGETQFNFQKEISDLFFQLSGDHSLLRLTDDGATPRNRSQVGYGIVIVASVLVVVFFILFLS